MLREPTTHAFIQKLFKRRIKRRGEINFQTYEYKMRSDIQTTLATSKIIGMKSGAIKQRV